MAIEVGSAYVSIFPSFQGFASKLQAGIGDEGVKVGQRLGKQVGDGVEAQTRSAGARAASGVLGSFRGLAGGMLAAAGIGAGFSLFTGIIADARESAKVAAITANAIQSTGAAAQITAGQVGDLATAISNKTGADDEAVQSGQNLLLTFTGIQNRAGANNDIFNQASQTLVDMTAAMNGGNVSSEAMKGTAIQLGKALNDPAKGMSALQRVGVTFTDQQKDQITAMEKAGDVAGAQRVILSELNKEFGGTAAAATNPMQRLSVVFGNLEEQLGGALLPYVDKFATFMSGNLIPNVSAFAESVGPKVSSVLGAIGGGFKALFSGLTGSGAAGQLKGVADILWQAGLGVRALVMAFQDGDVTSDGFVGGMERVGAAARTAFDAAKATITGVFDFVKANTGWLEPLAAGALAIAGTMKAISIAQSAVNTAQAAGRAISDGILVARRMWAVITGVATTAEVGLADSIWASTAAMLASPITWIIIGIVAVGVALYEMYQHWTAFRVFANAAMHAVAAAASWLWNVVLKPAFTAIGHAAMWLWDNAIKPAFNFITGHWRLLLAIFMPGVALIIAAVRLIASHWGALWNNVLRPTWNAITAAWRFVVAGISTVWTTVLAPVFRAIGAVVGWLWNVVIHPAFTLMWDIVKVVFTGIWLMWTSVLWPVFKIIGAIVWWLWSTIFKVAFFFIKLEWNALVAALKLAWDIVGKPLFDAIGAVAMWLWRNVLAPAWAGIKAEWNLLVAALKWTWDNVLHPVFDTVASVVHDVAGRIGAAFDGIAGFFSRAFADAKNAIIIGWDTIASWVNANVIDRVNGLFHIGISHLPTVSVISNAAGSGGSSGPQHGLARFAAAGGHIRGPGTSTSDSIPAMLSDGEFVINARAVRAIGVDTLNRLNAAGQLVNVGPGGDAGGARMRISAFADGGLVDTTKAWIAQQAGKPYQMGATGPGQWDCSGLVGAVWALLNGKSPYRRYFSTVNEGDGFFKPGFGGPGAFNVGWEGGGGDSGHTVGQLGGLYFEATPPRVLVGRTNYQPGSPLFTSHGHLDVGTQTAWGWLLEHTVADVRGELNGAMSGLAAHLPQLGMLSDVLRGIITTAVGSLTFDGGGLLPQGRWMVQHNAAEPDRVLNAAQWDVAERAMDRAGAGAAPVIHVHPRAEHSEADIAAIVSRELAWAMR